MGKGYNNSLVGKCISDPPIGNNIGLFKELCIHAYNHSPTAGTPFTTGLFGCKANQFLPAGKNIEFLPYQVQDPSTILRMYEYGRETNTVTLPYYFNSLDLDNIQPRNVVPPPYSNFSKAAGPAVSSDFTTIMIKRRLANNNDYVGRKEYDFVNATVPMPETPDTCTINDWLCFMHPATALYTNVDNPFLALQNYEQSGSTPQTKNIIPFCEPITARDVNGNIVGTYTGYTWIYIFGLANVCYPMRKYLPPNEWSPLLTKPRVNPNYTFYSLEARVYLVGNNIESTYLNRIRYWLYSQAPSFQPDWTTPFFLKAGQVFGTNLNFDVKFNLVGGLDTTIPFGLTSQQFMVTF